METKEKTTYSFSRLESFKQCPRGFYYSYIAKLPRGNNIYGFIGNACHTILEELQQDKITKAQALEMFDVSLIEADMNGYEWMSENVRNKYVAAIKHYLENYKPIQCDKFEIEEQFNIELNGHKITGFIDLYTITDDVIDIYDYKTSSNFGKDLPKKMRQMVLYGIALKDKYPDMKINTMNFDMLKYYKVPSKRSKMGYVLKDRSEIDILDFDDKNNAYLTELFEEKIMNEAINYFTNTIEEIEGLDGNIESYDKKLNPNKDFFCKTLCSFKDICIKE